MILQDSLNQFVCPRISQFMSQLWDKILAIAEIVQEKHAHKKCRGLTAEEELVLMQMLDVKMFLKKEALKERITTVRKKSLGSVSSLSHGLFYPSIYQVGFKTRRCRQKQSVDFSF